MTNGKTLAMKKLAKKGSSTAYVKLQNNPQPERRNQKRFS